MDYLAATANGTFSESVLNQRLLAFEGQWQLEKWGDNEGEEWAVTGNLGDILVQIKEKWGPTFASAVDRS